MKSRRLSKSKNVENTRKGRGRGRGRKERVVGGGECRISKRMWDTESASSPPNRLLQFFAPLARWPRSSSQFPYFLFFYALSLSRLFFSLSFFGFLPRNTLTWKCGTHFILFKKNLISTSNCKTSIIDNLKLF